MHHQPIERSAGRQPARSAGARPSRPGAPSGLLDLQRTAGNAAVSSMMAARRALAVQRQSVPPVVPGPPSFVLSSLTVAGAVPVVGAADTFVGNAGSTIDVTAQVASGTGAPVTARDIRWTGGSAGTTTTTRRKRGAGRTVVTAKVDGVSRTVTLFIVGTPAPPAANAVAPRAFSKTGTATPTGFGLTVVTIGQQGVTAPTFAVTPHFDAGRWVFRLVRIRHGFKVGVNGHGRRNITGPGSVRPAQLAAVIADLTPPGAGVGNGPLRTRFWNQAITTAHEQAHVNRFYSAAFWGASMTTFETNVETAAIAFDPTTASTAAKAMATQAPIFTADMATQHRSADAAELPGGEVAAHGVSNPMYTTLLAAIVAGVRPPAARTLAAVPAQTGVTLTWAQDAAVTNGAVVERATGRGPFAPAGTVAAGVLTFTDAGLTPNTRFRYRVTARGNGGPNAAAAAVATRTTP